MSFIKVRDQNGNPPEPSGRLDVALTPSGFTSPQDRRFTDNAGNVSFTGCTIVWPDAHGKFKLEVNTTNVNNNYGTGSLDVPDIEAQEYLITVQKHSDPVPVPGKCPVNHDKGQFTEWFWAMINRTGITVCSNQALVQLAPELEKCGMVWQNQKVYPQDKWRPRIFQPPLNPPNYDSPWFVDCGDFGGPWVLTFRY